MKRTLSALTGLIAGILNGLLGAGGGMVVVPSLSKAGLDQQKAHATSICVILPICIVSGILYLSSNRVAISDAMPYLGWGVLGSIIGTIILQKIHPKLLKKLFAILMIWAAYRMVFR